MRKRRFMFSLACGIIAVVLLVCAYIIEYPLEPNYPNIYQALPEDTGAFFLIFTFVFSVLGVVLSCIERRKYKPNAVWYINVIVCSILSVWMFIIIAIGAFWGYVFS